MLYWICPECGHECSPAIRECPTCAMDTESAPAASAPAPEPPEEVRPESRISQEIVALAQSFEQPEAVTTEITAAPSAESVSSVNGHTNHHALSTVATVEEPVEVTEPRAPVEKAPETEIDSLVRPLVESAKAAPLPATPAPPAAPAAPLVAPPCAELRPAEPAMSEPLRPREEFARAPKGTPAMLSSSRPRIELDPLPPMATGLAAIDGAQPQASEPIPPKKPRILPSTPPPAPTPAVIEALAPEVSFELPAADLIALNEALQEPSPCEADEVSPVAVQPKPRSGAAGATGPLFDSAHVTPANEPLAEPEPEYDTEVVAEAMEHQAASVREAIAEHEIALRPEPLDADALSQALQIDADAVVDDIGRQVEAEQASIQAIAKTFRQQPAASLLAAAPEILTAPAPPATQWIRTPRPVLKPCSPSHIGLNLITGPKAPTLAGPCLPPQLQNFLEQRSNTPHSVRKPIAFPTWLVSVVVATCLFLGAGSLMQYLTPNHDAKAASAAPGSPTSAPVPAPAAAPPMPVVQEHPLARFVEVAGVRVVNGAKGKPQLEYIVINHSGSPITGLDVRIAGRSADAPSGDPLFSVSGIVPALGPYQSREMHTDLDAGLRAASLPDWRSLRTEILVARH